MYKHSIPITDLETMFTKVISSLNRKDIKLSVYTNEFDFYMFKLFFPEITTKFNDETFNSTIAFTTDTVVSSDIIKKHLITIVRYKKEDEQQDTINVMLQNITYEKLDKINRYLIIIRSSESIDRPIEKIEKNAPAECTYLCTLFPPKKGIDINKLKITTVGVYSVTSYKSNLEIVKIIRDSLGYDITILDATACVGGDTIGFAMHFKNVISTERDKINYNALVNNINVYKLTNVKAINTDVIENLDNLLLKYKPDIVYWDCPWTGKDYKLKDKMELYMNDKNIKDIVKEILSSYLFVKMVVLKVPKNYDYTNIAIHKKFELKKFDVLVFYREEDKEDHSQQITQEEPDL